MGDRHVKSCLYSERNKNYCERVLAILFERKRMMIKLCRIGDLALQCDSVLPISARNSSQGTFWKPHLNKRLAVGFSLHKIERGRWTQHWFAHCSIGLVKNRWRPINIRCKRQIAFCITKPVYVLVFNCPLYYAYNWNCRYSSFFRLMGLCIRILVL